MSDPTEKRLRQAQQKARARGMRVQQRKSPPYGWELVATGGRVIESGTLTDIELALHRQERTREPSAPSPIATGSSDEH